MSLRIDISNYESYVIDFMDGALNQEDKAHFEAFLLKHPNVAIQVEELIDTDYSLTPIESINDKESLKFKIIAVAGIDESNYEEAMAAFVDSELHPDLAANMAGFIAANPVLKKDFDLYQATKLTPTNDLVFVGKSDLKKPIPLFAPSLGTYRIAAAILVLFGIISLLNSIEDEIYIPRNGSMQFASISIDVPATYASDEPTKMIASEINESIPMHIASRTTVPAMARNQTLKKWAPQPIGLREASSLAFVLPREAPGVLWAQNERTEELNLTQFIGKELLGLAPDKTQTTKSLLKESAKKVIDQSEQFAVNIKRDVDNKKTFSLLAGAIEFKRVTYNSN